MKNISSVLIGLTLLAVVACSKDEKETPSGFKFTVLKAGDGVLPKRQDMVVFNFVLKDSKDSTWANTYDQGFPSAVPIGDSLAIPNEKGLIQMFRMLSKGDSVAAKLPIKNFFEIAGGMPPFKVDTTLTMTYTIAVVDVMDRERFQEFRTNLAQELGKKQDAKDEEVIKKYLTEHNIEAQMDSTGIAYVLHRSKGKAKPDVQSCVEVSYKGSLLEDGQVFDQSPKISFPLVQLMPGWQKAIPMLGIGDSATFYIPSGLAYGPQGSPGTIPPNAVLIFEVGLENFTSGFDPATRTCK